jgi:hypothetical protein
VTTNNQTSNPFFAKVIAIPQHNSSRQIWLMAFVLHDRAGCLLHASASLEYVVEISDAELLVILRPLIHLKNFFPI